MLNLIRKDFAHLYLLIKFRAQAGIPWGACHFLTMTYCKGVADMADMTYEGGNIWHRHTAKEEMKFLYEDVDTFAVVRNPYERAISSYYYEARHKPDFIFNRLSLNDYILNQLQHDWKYKPQSLYIYDQEGKKVVDHVLHFETLGPEFKNLMEDYNINVSMPDHEVNGRIKSAKLSFKHLNKFAINFINEYYDQDFSNFGYEKVTKGNTTRKFVHAQM